MRMNWVETALVNNPVRDRMRTKTARALRRMGGTVDGGVALEIGCGRGVGTMSILREFGARRVDAFDLDDAMVRRARRRLAPLGRDVRVWRGDASRIEAEDGTYDAVFDFSILHHVPHWRDALDEVHRVLKPGGRFFVEEVLRDFILHPVWKRVLEHPLEDRFDHDDFCHALIDRGFDLVASRDVRGKTGLFVADKPLGTID